MKPLQQQIANINIRRATMDDMPLVAVIESAVQATPWSLAVLQMSLMTDEHFWVMTTTAPLEINDNPSQGTSKNPTELIIGFAVANSFPPSSDLTNIGIHPHWQRMGLGERLMHHMIDEIKQSGAFVLTLEVRLSNHRAQKLYRKLGFTQVGYRKNYYRVSPLGHEHEDGLVLSLYLS